MARISRILGVGRLPWMILPRTLDSAFKGRLPAARHDELVAEMRRWDMPVFRRMVVRYFDYLDQLGSLVLRLCDSGVAAWVVRGDRDEVGLTDDERRRLTACTNVTLVEVPDAAHFVMTDQPTRTAELIFDVMAASPGRDKDRFSIPDHTGIEQCNPTSPDDSPVDCG